MSVNDNRAASQTFDNSAEVTRIGRVIRRYKIDELPQIINILIGDMSFVGPRPSLPDLVNEINPKYHRRYDVRPGLTGLAQTNGNVYIDWEERCEYDLRYIDTMSLKSDLEILVKTVFVVLFGENHFVQKK